MAAGLAGAGGPGCSQADSRFLSSDDILGKGAALILPGLRPSHRRVDVAGDTAGRIRGGTERRWRPRLTPWDNNKEGGKGQCGRDGPSGAATRRICRGLTPLSLKQSGQHESRASHCMCDKLRVTHFPLPAGSQLPNTHARQQEGEGGRVSTDVTESRPRPSYCDSGGRLRSQRKCGSLEPGRYRSWIPGNRSQFANRNSAQALY